MTLDPTLRPKPTLLSLSRLKSEARSDLMPMLAETLVQPSYISALTITGSADMSLVDSAVASIAGAYVLQIAFHDPLHEQARIVLTELCAYCGSEHQRHYTNDGCRAAALPGQRINRWFSLGQEPDSDEDEDEALQQDLGPTLDIDEVLRDRLELVGLDALTATLVASELVGVVKSLDSYNRS